MKWLILLPALILPASSAQGPKDDRKAADLQALSDPATREAEVARLVISGKNETLIRYRLFECRQRDGAPSLHLLATKRRFEFGFGQEGNYKLEHPEELIPGAGDPLASAAPELSPFDGDDLFLFDSTGKALEPFRETILNGDYLYDFNHDGIIERASSSEWTGQQYKIEVFHLQTIEPHPRTLLDVVFNWRPKSKSSWSNWNFRCFRQDGDDNVEIGFGPADAEDPEEQRVVIFRCDPKTGKYATGNIPSGTPIRLLKEGESLEEFEKNAGLDDLQNQDDRAFPPAPSQAKPYVFASLKDLSVAELSSFFQGNPTTGSWQDTPDFPNRLPDGFWKMEPKQAALALAEANRSEKNRLNWKLVVDDRGGAAPPSSGWLLHTWTSSGCYSLSEHQEAIRFGKDRSWLVFTAVNFNGAVDGNPFADQRGYDARLIPISNEEARFLADTLFWLSRIRSYSPDREARESFGGSTADGMAELSLLTDGSSPENMGFDQVWATASISQLWQENYTPSVFINFADHLIDKELKLHLGDRWGDTPDVEPRSTSTSLRDRLAPRLDEKAREAVSKQIAAIFALDAQDPVPAPVLRTLVSCAGDEVFEKLLPDLRARYTSLPPEDAEDVEFQKLEKKETASVQNGIKDPFQAGETGDPVVSESREDTRKRYFELLNKREFLDSPVLRQPLKEALDKFRIASDPGLLKKEIEAQTDGSRWALTRLRLQFPVQWAEELLSLFPTADDKAQGQIFDVISLTQPDATKKLIAGMSPKERGDWLLRIVDFDVDEDPASVPALIPELLRALADPACSAEIRCSVISRLVELHPDPDQSAALTRMLLREWKNPSLDPDGSWSTEATVIAALSRRLSSKSFMKLIIERPLVRHDSIQTAADSIVRVFKDDPQRQKILLIKLLSPGFRRSQGSESHFFMSALAYDLRNFAPQVASFASESNAVPDGIAADAPYSGFAGPVGWRYHAAREVTALWMEKDAGTRARMWLALATNRSEEFVIQKDWPSSVAVALRKRTEAAAAVLPSAVRKEVIPALLVEAGKKTGQRPDPQISAWLTSLAGQ